MKKINKIIIFVIILFSLIQIVLAVPNSINIQGKLTDSSDKVKTGTFNFSFGIYDNFTSGNKLYESNITATTNARGIYDIILNNINISFDKQLYLGVQVNNNNEMEPRVNLTAVPYSFRANTSESLDENKSYTVSGLNVTQSLIVGGGANISGDLSVNNEINLTSTGNIDASGNLSISEKITFTLGEIIDNLVNGFLTITGGLNVTESLIIKGGANVSGDLGVSGRVGIGTTSPTQKLDVNGSVNVNGNTTITGDLNVTGTSYLGEITLTSDNITVNGIVSKDGNISFYNSSGSELVRITNDGNVGIGTTVPTSSLHITRSSYDGTPNVYGTQISQGVIELTRSGSPYIDFKNDIGAGDYDARILLRNNDFLHLQGASLGIGYTSSTTGSTGLVVAGNVGIGTTTPAQRLHVAGGNALIDQGYSLYVGASARFYSDATYMRYVGPRHFYITSSVPNTYLYSTNTYLGASSGDAIHLRSNSFDWNTGIINTSGNMAIGTTAFGTATKFRVYNSAALGASNVSVSDNAGTSGGALDAINSSASNSYNAFEGVTYGTYSGVFGLHQPSSGAGYGVYGTTNTPASAWGMYADAGGIYCGAGSFWASDRRFKKDIKDLPDGTLNKILQLKPSEYYYNIEEYPVFEGFNEKRFGLIAQDLEKIFPEVINNTKSISNPKKKIRSANEPADNVSGYYSVDYISLIPILIKGIQEQQTTIESQNEEIEELKERVIKLENE